MERTTYERLKSARRAGESFTDVIDRLLAGREPRLSDFASLFDPKTAREIGESVEALRREEIKFERAKLRARR